MWDFSVFKSLSIMARTMPFILFRMAVYFGITLATIMATGAGAGIGYGIGNITDDPTSYSVWGGLAGFGLISALVYWVREYILYMVKAGHIAVMVKMIDGEAIPSGQGQIGYAHSVVKDRFGEANVLFVLDQLIKGAIGAITGLISGITSFIPIPGLSQIVGIINGIIRVSLTYVDEIILAYNVRIDSDNPWETSRHGVVLYAQNAGRMVKNAVWVSIFMWITAVIVFLVALAPAGAILLAFPGDLGGYGFILAIVFAWAFNAAFMEPFAIACLMQAYFKAIEGQRPDPAWDAKLATASDKFRDLVDRGRQAFGGRDSQGQMLGRSGSF